MTPPDAPGHTHAPVPSPLPCAFLEGLSIDPANDRGTAGTIEPVRCGLPATRKSVQLFGKPLCAYHFEQACRDQMEV